MVKRLVQLQDNALIVLDGHVELVRAGEQVPVWILDED